MSYLNDLLFIKQSAKSTKPMGNREEKDVVKYFKDDTKDKIIYKNIVY